MRSLSLIGLAVSALAYATWNKETNTLSQGKPHKSEKLTNYLDGWHNTEVHNGPSFMYKASSQGASFGKTEAREKVIAVITARDLYIGCHSYRQYLSPHFETIFAFHHKYADLFELDKLVTSMDRNQTLGAHLFVTDSDLGENSARSLALGFIENIMETQPEFMFSVNCDMHPIPTNHKLHQTFEQITEGLASTMYQERELRENGKSSWTQREELGADDKPIYAMNTLIWLDFNSTDHLFDAEWHGKDHYDWYNNSFLTSAPKPDVLAQAGASWTTEVDFFVESHALCFDVQKMRTIRDEYFIWDSIPSETHAIGPLANKHGWVVRRHNELHMFFDQARYEEVLNDEKYAPIAGHQDKIDQMLFMNFELASKRRNPIEGYNIYQQYVKKNGVHMPDYYGGGFISFIWRDHYIPSFIHKSKATSEEGKRWIYSSMRMAGYVPTGENNTFETPGAYPSTLQITVHDELQDDKNSFLTFYNGDKVTDYVTYDPIQFHVGNDYPADRRTFTLPINDKTILDATNGAIGRRLFYDWGYFHVVQEECERDVTYDKPSAFIEKIAINHDVCIGCD
eukprot:CAMPEP_0167785292 /NCGR_PEP_ID=MMETSP0111_2-20121227/8153_1 /TAXON_ID=91324 /ORGANISM="Lotharella globosa, Strain CCCM811" /LENGTH=567 /DNA_ID=CAMNT_0007676541 /DNA_START=121 /DNA_END=1824 /DNA_ORIENTATION=+